jgi:hypothetical protein
MTKSIFFLPGKKCHHAPPIPITPIPIIINFKNGWSPKLREEHRLGVFENRVLKRIFGPRRDEVTGEWRKLHNEELRDLYSSPSIIRIMKARRMRLARHVA